MKAFQAVCGNITRLMSHVDSVKNFASLCSGFEIILLNESASFMSQTLNQPIIY
jgi:hypothetical protein